MPTATFVTNRGSFTVQLMPDHAPQTVENFVGLANGTKGWTDPRDGQEKTEALLDDDVLHDLIVLAARVGLERPPRSHAGGEQAEGLVGSDRDLDVLADRLEGLSLIHI